MALFTTKLEWEFMAAPGSPVTIFRLYINQNFTYMYNYI